MSFTTRPVVRGRNYAVTSGHYLATAAGVRMLEMGGNAIDAAAAACFALNLLEPQSNGIGGEVPMLVYIAAEQRVYALSGQGWSPQAFTIAWCREHGIDLIPGDGYLPACTPAVVGTWALAVARWGRLSFSQILAPTIELAERGYPLYAGLRQSLIANAQKFTELYPTTGAVYLPNGRIPELGEPVRNPDYAAMLRRLCRAEDEARRTGRIAGIEAARNAFYEGEIAHRIVEFIRAHPVADASGQAHAGLLSDADLAEWHARVEAPVSIHYRGLDVYKCGPWTQGPVFLQQLALLEGYDLAAMGHNSPEYLHILIECAKLAFADREAYYGDPDFDAVPLDSLLSKSYAAQRRAQIGDTASDAMQPGDLGFGVPDYATTFDVAADNRRGLQVPDAFAQSNAARPYRIKHGHLGDTTHLDVIDGEGNMVAATPSGGWWGTSPVIAGLGFPLGTRGQMFYLNPNRPNALAPRKRPRATLTPTLVLKDGRPYMVFGTPGGDAQDQWTLQFFLNVVEFGMDLQQALDAPIVHSTHFPSSFYPRDAYPRAVEAENRIAPETLEALRRRGHLVNVSDAWSHGKCMGIRLNAHGTLEAGVSPRGEIGYAMAW
ncbi:MAG: gamma-glutamyltranspeptidase [Candidatus Roseilinea sp.]|nr:MAG: gamma-glutamyltranspeptidase [Candidatus Roseilinea sp.]